MSDDVKRLRGMAESEGLDGECECVHCELRRERAALLTRAADALELLEQARKAEPLPVRDFQDSPVRGAHVTVIAVDCAPDVANKQLAHRLIRTAIGLLGKEKA